MGESGAVKRYEISYGDQVLRALAEAAGDGVVECSVRQLAAECGLSASAVQIGLHALRRSGRIATRRKGTAGRPSLVEVVSTQPLAPPVELGVPGEGLGDAFVQRYEQLLVELTRARARVDELDELRARVAELEAENAELRASVAQLGQLVGEAQPS